MEGDKIEAKFLCPMCGKDYTISSNSTIEQGDIVKCSKCKNFYVLSEEYNAKEMGRKQHQS